MAIYHLSVKPISRSAGRSATGAAAYRAGEKIADTRTGEIHDYTRKQGVAHSQIVLPSGSEWSPSRAELWNAAEHAEKRKDACVAREHEIALPHELTDTMRLALVESYARDLAERHKCAVDFAIHAPGKGEGNDLNWHAHVLCTTREVTGQGLGQKCQREKAGQDRRADLDFERKRWEAFANLALEREGLAQRVDSRSLKDQGIDRAPTSHRGPAVSGLVKRGQSSQVIERIQAEAAERLQAAQRLGELERQEALLQRGLILISNDIAAAKKAAQAPKLESYYSPANVAARKAQASRGLGLELPSQSLASLRQQAAPPQQQPEPTPAEALAKFRQSLAKGKEEARKALALALAEQGKVVRPDIVQNVPYLGTVQVSADRQFLIQDIGRNHVAIHDLAKLEGRYASGQKVEIRYQNGRGRDKLQEQPEQSKSKGRDHDYGL